MLDGMQVANTNIDLSADDAEDEEQEKSSQKDGTPELDLAKTKMQKTSTFDQDKLTDNKYAHDDVVETMNPEDFNLDYYHKEGLSKVLLFDCNPAKLGMIVPPSDFTPRDVKDRIGDNRSVKYFNVEEGVQETYATGMEDFVNYYESPREKTFNVISLEVSCTRMTELIRAPELVRQVDLGLRWPDERKQRKCLFQRMEGRASIFDFRNAYPRVEHYCLISPAGSYTSFHTDFHGSSVWYHVLSGQKIFFIIEPSEVNIGKFEEHMLDVNDLSFFGDRVEKCTRVVVKAGQTLVLPAGWIHSVFTPVDSLVFGGNFIHARSLQMQCRIVRHETKLNLKKDEKYPFYDEVFFYAMDIIVKEVTGRSHIRPASKNRQKEGFQYVGAEFIKQQRHHRIPRHKDFIRADKKAFAWKRFKETEEYTEMRRIFAEYDNEERVMNVDPSTFFVHDHPHICYHPESFGIDKSLKTSKRNPCNAALPAQFDEDDAKMSIDNDILRQLIHPSEIVEWEALVQSMRKKPTVKLPEGLTRPSLLLHSFSELLSRLRDLHGFIKSPFVDRSLSNHLYNRKLKSPQKKKKRMGDASQTSEGSLTNGTDSESSTPSTSKNMTFPADHTYSREGEDSTPVKRKSLKGRTKGAAARGPAASAVRAPLPAHVLAAAARARADPALAPASPSSPYCHAGMLFSKDESDVIICICVKKLLEQREAGSNQDLWLSAENVAYIQTHLPHRTIGQLLNHVGKLKAKPGIKAMLDDFRKGTLNMPNTM